MMIMKLGLALCASMAFTAGALAQPQSLPTGKCINAGNHLETGGEAAWGGKKLDVSDFANIRKAGFETVRLPVNWSQHVADNAANTVDPKWMAIVQSRVDEALASGLKVIVNSHNFKIVHNEPERGSIALANVWKQVAARFADYPKDRLWFEIENEPHNNLNNANLWATLGPALAAIRSTNPTRPVIFGGEKWSGVDSLETLELPDDPNLWPTFHYYSPFMFTHQGATWVGNQVPPLGRKFPIEADKVEWAANLSKIQRFITRTGKVPFMGENGAIDLVPLEERVAFHKATTEAFKPLGIEQCVWAYTNTFPFYDHETRQWHKGLLEAIGIAGSQR